jgi:hypothetical protein
MYDRLFVEVRLIVAVEKLLRKSEIRIAMETQLYGQLIEGCIHWWSLDVTL